MEKLLTIYHGSEKIIEKPAFGKGRRNNDYGLGFYCTESKMLAKEWAVSSLRNGFSNQYVLDTEYLNVLKLRRRRNILLPARLETMKLISFIWKCLKKKLADYTFRIL